MELTAGEISDVTNPDRDNIGIQEPGRVAAKVNGLATGGWCVATVYDAAPDSKELIGMKIFLTQVVPGEDVLVEVKKRKERFLEGEVVEILTPAPERTVPPCPYYGSCGGCQLQHIEPEAQRRFKMEMMISAMRAAKLPEEMIEQVEPLRHYSEFNYRRRMALGVKRNGSVGLHRRRSFEVIPVRRCLIATEVINDSLGQLDKIGDGFEGLRGTLHLEADQEKLLAILRLERKLAPDRVHALIAVMRGVFPSARIESCGEVVASYGDQKLTLTLAASDSLTLDVPGGSFSQTNWEVNRDLVATVVEYATSHSVKSAHDICSGAGNFAIPLALRGITTTAVECDRSLVSLGSEQAKNFGLDNRLTFVRGSMEKFLAKYPQEQRIDLIVADPPRSGLGDMCRLLGYGERLILISCYLPSFVRDVSLLSEEGWRMKKVIPFEMFPQTTHLEIMTVMER